MLRLSPLVLAPPLIFAALAAVFFIGMQRENPDALPSTREGQPAPPVPVTDLGRIDTFDHSALREPGVKLVNFWASWCVPCRVEHPNLERLAAEGLPIYGINYKDEPEKALAFLEELGNPFAGLGTDDTGRIGIDWGLYGVPETYVIDGDGTVILRFAGPITDRALTGQIRPAIEAARQAN